MVARTPMSVAQFERIAESLGSCELVRGEVVRVSPGGLPHSTVSANVAYLLSQWARKSRKGRVLANEAGIVTSDRPATVRGADVAFVSYRRLPRRARPSGFARVAPELVVEIVGSGQTWKQTFEKAGEYLGMGVDRVWIVDVRRRRVHVLHPDAPPVVLSEKDAIADAEVLPGFRCKVSEFFE